MGLLLSIKGGKDIHVGEIVKVYIIWYWSLSQNVRTAEVDNHYIHTYMPAKSAQLTLDVANVTKCTSDAFILSGCIHSRSY